MKNYVLILLLLAVAYPAQALLMDNSAQVDPINQVIEFTEFTSSPTTTQGPVEVGSSVDMSVQWNAANAENNAFVGNDAFYSIGNNGLWTSDQQGYVALNNASGAIQFTFENNVSEVGAVLNYLPDSSNHTVLTAYDRQGQVLETYDINNLAPISTPRGTNQGAFRGIKRTMADIAMFEVSNSYVVLDHLTYGQGGLYQVVTPEPGSIFTILIGIMAIFGLKKVNHHKD